MDDTAASKGGPSGTAKSGRRIPGSYTKRKVRCDVVPYGHASQDICETVYRTVLSEYGLSGSNEEMRDEMLWCLAETLVHGTSSEISWGDVWFTTEGSRHSMATFASIVGRFIGHTNPVRVWTRDFRKGEIPMRMFEMLSNPDNTELRQTVAANYGTTVDNARFCFDTSSALIASGLTLSHSDIFAINALATYTIARAQQDGQSRGDTQASSNHAGVIGGVRPGVAVPSGPVAPVGERAGFKALR